MKRVGTGRRVVFEPEDDAYIREYYPTGTASDIGDHFGVSGQVITRRAKVLGLKKADGWSKNNFYKRYTGTYQYGNYVPYNKSRQNEGGY